MKRLNNRQLRVIVALNFVIICLLISFWAVYPFFPSSTETGGKDLEEYSRGRTAQISLNPHLGWQMELLGSNEEEIVFTYVHNDLLYIFGNTLSGDFDFDESGIFLVIMDAYGKTFDDGFIILSKDILRSVIISNLGFVLAIESQTSPYLMVVDFDGGILKRTEGFVSSYENISNLYLYNEGFILLSKNGNRLRCSFFDFSLTYLTSTLTDSLVNLSVKEIFFVSNRVIVFANALSGGISMPSSIVFEPYASAKVKIFDDYLSEIKGVSVNKGQFILLTTYNICSILRISIQLEVLEVIPLSLSNPIFLTDIDGEYYTAFLSSGLMLLNENLTNIGSMEFFNPVQFISAYNIFCTLNEQSKITLIAFNKKDIIYNASIEYGENPLVFINDRHFILTYIKGGNIFISSLRYP